MKTFRQIVETKSNIYEDMIASEERLAEALRRAAEAHHVYEAGLGRPDPDWAGWYAHWIFEHYYG